MTRTQFVTALEQALRADPDAHPHYTFTGAMRLDRGTSYYCPLTYLAQRLGKGEFHTSQAREAGVALELRPLSAKRLLDAADGAENQTRQRLETLWKPAGRKGA